MEEVEEEQVERGEGAQDAARHDQQQDVELLLALLDLPGDAGRGEGDDGAHQDQADVDAVHADVVADAQAASPRGPAARTGSPGAPALNWRNIFSASSAEIKRGQDGYGAHHRPEGARHQQQHNRCEERPADDVGERGHAYFSTR